MLMSLSGGDECRTQTLHALRSNDESRDDVLRQFVRLSSQALGIPGSFISVLDDEMRQAVERLLRCLHDPMECRIMGPARLREVLFAALRGPQAGVLRALVEQQGQFARVAASLSHLHEHFAEPLSVETLARCANMSASTFHEHFKRSTLLSPVQYLKRLRLLRAQQLLLSEGLGVAQVAERVGYQSTSQFSREYKRYFERSPGNEGAGTPPAAATVS